MDREDAFSGVGEGSDDVSNSDFDIGLDGDKMGDFRTILVVDQSKVDIVSSLEGFHFDCQTATSRVPSITTGQTHSTANFRHWASTDTSLTEDSIILCTHQTGNLRTS